MKISNKTRHAIRIITYLLANGKTTARVLAEHVSISQIHVEGICWIMKKLGIIETIRGAKGGYMVSEVGKTKSLWHLISAFDKDSWSLHNTILDEFLEQTKEAAMAVKISDFTEYDTEKFPTKSEPELLSRKEKEVVIAVANGMTTPEIAGHMELSHHTIIRHRDNIKKKTGFRTAACFARFAISNKMIEA